MDAHTRAAVTNAQEIISVVSDIVLEHAASRPSNMQAEFKQWCAAKNNDDGCLVYEGKLVTFLKTHIIPRGNKRQKDQNGKGRPLSIASVEAYAKAVIDLYKLQQTLKTNSHPHPRGKAYHDLFDTLKRKETERKRAQYVDRGLGTILDGYNVEDMKQLSDFWLIDNNGDALRDRADFFLGQALLARGETRRFIEFPDMLSLELPDEGPQGCTPLVIIMNRGKTNQHGQIEYGAALRCKMELICPLNAIELEPFPDMSCPENWYDIRLINGTNKTKDMPYNTQLNRIKRAFDACGIDLTVWTHANRGSGAKLAENCGASEEQIRRLGRWNAARMEGCYLTSLPKKAMRALAGSPTKGGSYWLHRACVVPRKKIQRLVFPEVEKAEVLIAANKKPRLLLVPF
ncbi:Short-chain dehydrogenase [Phytophthora palmivora]|uniref:Short-chain dehydrogenase n=1 Tax=Phytophthora palmivora TaxID=4796 RepID=A0A2P4X005_9STRA|nr:Short-chain dehydrogenase [Phytophthora palmivora]